MILLIKTTAVLKEDCTLANLKHYLIDLWDTSCRPAKDFSTNVGNQDLKNINCLESEHCPKLGFSSEINVFQLGLIWLGSEPL